METIYLRTARTVEKNHRFHQIKKDSQGPSVGFHGLKWGGF